MSFKCGICGKEYETVEERAACEASCLENQGNTYKESCMCAFEGVSEKFNAFTDALIDFIHTYNFSDAMLHNTDDGFRFCVTDRASDIGLVHSIDYVPVSKDELQSSDEIEETSAREAMKQAHIDNIDCALAYLEREDAEEVDEDDLFEDEEDVEEPETAPKCAAQGTTCKKCASAPKKVEKSVDKDNVDNVEPVFTIKVNGKTFDSADFESMLVSAFAPAKAGSKVTVGFSSDEARNTPFGSVMNSIFAAIKALDDYKS